VRAPLLCISLLLHQKKKKEADAHSTKKFGLNQPRPSPDSPSSVTGSSTTATTPRHLACHAPDDLYGQDSVRSSDGFDGMHDEGDSDGIGCCYPPPPSRGGKALAPHHNKLLRAPPKV
jgi:hypothetical protein